MTYFALGTTFPESASTLDVEGGKKKEGTVLAPMEAPVAPTKIVFSL
eukprot:CAMPEP_0176148166 /NCGR_PEP_ID=MMETSP0120_2-20121206/75547_1 /TAXON_ID=160619 /ORGANISM="Kryptoperidinium foliaceum, Strain CCMP 1326" /LENGTH=46 /DNA_ID= /DNA_START= /DNA_END= /DNA_ORIENTATION=